MTRGMPAVSGACMQNSICAYVDDRILVASLYISSRSIITTKLFSIIFKKKSTNYNRNFNKITSITRDLSIGGSITQVNLNHRPKY